MVRTPPPNLKPLSEVDAEFRALKSRATGRKKNPPPPDSLPEASPQPAKWKRIMTDVVLYTAILGVLSALYFGNFRSESTAPKNLLGYSVMRVLTESMKSVMPQDTLIITRKAEPGEIQVGDDITFLRRDNSTVTHRVVEIHNNYADTGMPGYKTKGTDNPRPDQEIVAYNNVVGRVVYHNTALGKVIKFIGDMLPFIVISLALIIGIIIAMKVFFNSKPEDDTEESMEKGAQENMKEGDA